MKRKYIVIGVLIVLILGLVVADFVINPTSGAAYDLLDISKAQISAVEIHHFGKGLTVTHPELVTQLVDLFDCNLERRGNDYLTNRTGGDWSITFLAKNGSQSKAFLFFPGSGSGETKLKIGHYYYAADKHMTSELLESLFFDTSITGQVKGEIESAYFFHKNHYDVIQGADGDVVFRPVSKSDLDYMMAEVIDGDSHGLIVSATVTGGSYNNLTLSEPYTNTLSNVYTPIRIDHIYSKGSSVKISVGETCYLYENYFYITDQLPELVNDSGKDAIYLRGADPLVYGQKYILYLYDMEKPPIAGLGSGTEQVLYPVANNLYAFPVGTKEEAKQALLDPSDAYWKTWQEVLATYPS